MMRMLGQAMIQRDRISGIVLGHEWLGILIWALAGAVVGRREGLFSSGFSLAHSLPAPIPADDKACHYGQSSPTHESCYRLADDRDDVEAP
jgi:hypothetical protein